MKNQEYYEQFFESYPDVVTLGEFKAMLGGIGETAARKILHGNHIKYLFIRRTYRILEVWVIEYVSSDHYAQYRQELKSTGLEVIKMNEQEDIGFWLMFSFHNKFTGHVIGAMLANEINEND